MKFRAHETFFIRKGWLFKGLKNVNDDPYIFLDRDNKKATDILGIGTNMVKALRYWMQVTGLTTEAREGNLRPQYLTDFGKIVFEQDKYFEEEGTLWYVHYKLATTKELATTWYWFFNEFNMKEFTKDDFVDSLDLYAKYGEELSSQVAKSSLEDDYSCLLNTYISRSKINSDKDPEDNIDCPLGQLDLLEIIDKKKRVVRKAALKKDGVHPLILMAAIAEKYSDGGIREIKISSLLNEPFNIGKVFNIDLNVLNYYLDRLQEMGFIKVVRTAGLDIVNIVTDLNSKALLEKYYVDINLN